MKGLAAPSYMVAAGLNRRGGTAVAQRKDIKHTYLARARAEARRLLAGNLGG